MGYNEVVFLGQKLAKAREANAPQCDIDDLTRRLNIALRRSYDNRRKR